MNKLETFTINPFYSINTAKDSIAKFGFDNYSRMKAANNPAYATRLVATKDAWEKLFGNLETYDADLVMRQNLTVQLNAKGKEFIDKSLQIEPLVEYKFGKSSGAYQMFYPYGRAEYSRASQENIVILMNRMVDGTHIYAAELGAGLEAEFTLLRDDYKDIYEQQKEKKGDVSEGIPDFDAKMEILYDELYLNMLTILAVNYKKPTDMLYYFDQTIVNYTTHIKTIQIQKQSKKPFELEFTADDTIIITSKFSKTLKYYFAPTAETEAVPPENELTSKLKVKIKGTAAGAPLNKFIIFTNQTDLDATVTVLVKRP